MSYKKDLKSEFSSIPIVVSPEGSVNGKRLNHSSSASSIVSNSSNSHSSNMKKTGSRNRSSHSNSHLHSKRNVQSYNNSNSRHQLIDDSPDILTIIKSSKKGMDISHLLTYNYSPDDDFDNQNSSSPSSLANNNNKNRSRNKNTKKKSSFTNITLSGLSYINANYKFILNYNGDYKSQLLDPNLPLDVNDIIRVIVKQHDYHCPICLGDEFIAPRMTKCGHIFCYSCLLNMFDNAREDKSKTNLGNLHNPTIYCPLCSEVIKEKFIQLPVLIEQVKENESKLNIKTYSTLSLMHRSNSKIYSQKVSNFYSLKDLKANIPWIAHGSTPLNYKQYSPYISNSRLMMCDLDFIISCYQKEIDDLMTQKLLDSEIYGDSGKYYDLAVKNINNQISLVHDSINSSSKIIKGPPLLDESSLSSQLNDLSLTKEKISLPAYKDGYYYYQCDINSRIHYFLSPLDVHVINELFKIPESQSKNMELEKLEEIENPAHRLPLSLNVFIESINFDEGKVTPELVTSFPFLGNLPYGAELGFLEIDWSKFDSSFIPLDPNTLDYCERDIKSINKYPVQLSQQIKKSLRNRSRNIKNKRANEENARIRGELRREKETLEIFSNDRNMNTNNTDDEDEIINALNSNRWDKNKFVHIDSIDNIPVLKGVSNSFSVLANVNDDTNNLDGNSKNAGGSINLNPPPMTTTTSVWGTRVPVVIDPEAEALHEEETRQFDEMIRKAKDQALESNSGKGKKGKKGRRVKMVPLPL
jgi:hypothetical protein